MFNWAAEENFGVTHYGCTPTEFPLSEVWPNFFHLDCAITKSLMTRLRKMVIGANLEFCKAFHCKLKGFFSDYHFSLWDLNKSLVLFKGKDCRAFVINATTLADWIEKTKLLTTKGNREWEGIIGGLRTYKNFMISWQRQ